MMLSRLLRRTSKKRKRPSIGVIFTMVMFLLVLLPAAYFVVFNPGQTQAAWFDGKWQYRKKITVDETQVIGTTNLTDFPMLVSITDSSLGTYAQTDGDDIVFTDVNGTKLDHEIASYTTGTGVLVAWVRVPTLYAQENTVIYMYYGNASAASQQNVAGTWSSEYMAVWHVDEVVTDEATTGTHKDSTLVNEPMTQTGNVNISGQVSNAQQLDGTDSLLRTNDTALGMADGADRVFSGWFYRDTFTTDDTLFARKNAQGASAGYMMWLEDATDDLNFDIYDGTDLYTINGSDAITAVGWHHFALVWDDDNALNTKIYIDGLDDTESRTGTIGNIGDVNATINFRIGAESDNGSTHTGRVDEYRMRSGTVTDEWIQTEFNNQNTPGTFSTVGSEEVSPSPVAFWKFDEGVDNTCSGGTNDACDSTGGLNDLARTNALWTEEGDCISGKCVSFDGSGDYFSKTDDADLDFAGTDSFTITGWFRHGPQTSGTDVIAVKYDAATDGGYRIQMESDGDISCSIDNDATSFPSDTVVSTAATYDDNKWHHFSCVKSASSSLTLYIDGSQVDQDTSITASSLANGDTFYIGIDGDGSSNGWQGFLDEIKVHRSAKSAAQVKTEYSARGEESGSSAVLGQNADNAYSFLTNGLVGYWKMDEAAANGCTGGTNDSCDSSSNGNDGAWNGSTTAAAGKFGNSITLDGADDYVDFGDPASGVLDPGSGSFTYSLWVRPASNVGSFDMPLSKGGSSASTTGYDIELGSGNWAASVSDGTTNVIGEFTATGTTGTWKMLTVVIDRQTKTLKLFMDGEQVDSDSIASLGAINTTNTLRLGVDHTSDFDYNGLVDDVRIYNRALSPLEVQGLYNWSAEPIGYWKFDDNTGTTAVDSSTSNTNPGTLTAGPTWRDGKYGSAVNFDGTDDNITLTTPTFRNTLKSFSVSMWMQVTGTLNGTTNAQFPLFFNLNGQTLYPRASVIGNGKLELQLRTGGVTSSFQTTASVIVPNTWYHVEYTFDGNTNFSAIYVNGVLSGTNTFGAGTLDGGTTGNVILGNDTNQSIFFKGYMDDVRLYNYARDSKQVVQDMNGSHPLGGSPVGSAFGNWALDEQGGQTAYNQTNLYNMTLGSSTSSDTNDPTWLLASSCKINGCLDFDGSNDYVQTADNDIIDMVDTDDFSISGWFYRDTFTTDDTIISKKAGQAASDTGFIVYVDDSTDDLTFEVADGTDEYMVEATSSNITAVGWNHFAIVFDQDNADLIKMYLNGVQQSTTKTGTLSSIGSLANSAALRLGTESDDGSPYDGRLDDVRIYKAALSAENVKIDYNANSSINFGTKTIEASNLSDGAGSNPTLYFNFDENNASASAQTITHESTTHVATGSATNTGTIPHNTGNNPNRMLVVAVNAEDSSATDIDVSSVTYNGRPLNLAIRREASSGNFGSVELWYLLNPPVGQYNLVTTFAGTVTNFAVAAQSFYNVRQDVPESTAQSTTGSGGVTTQTLTTTVPNSMLIDTVMNLSVTTYTAGTSQTERYDTANAAHASAGSTKLWAVPGSPTMTQTAASSTLQIHAAMAIAPAFNTTNIQDTSGSNKTGVLTGGMGSNSWSDGKYGSALKFDGISNYATVATPSFPTSDFTVEGWVNTADTSGTIFQITDDDTLEREVSIAIGEDGAAGAISGYVDATKEVESTTLANTNTWVHFAMTRNISSGDVFLYINGVLESSGTNTAVLDIGTCSAIFGAHPQTTSAPCIGTPNSSFFAGSIDDFKVYNYVRTPAQVAYDYNRGKPIGWWKLDECTGSTIYDSSGKSNNGTLTIGASGTYTAAGACNSGTSTHSWNTGSGGKYNASAALDGTNDWVDMNDIELFDWADTADFSISGWFYRGSATTDDTIIAKRNGVANTDDGFIVYLDDATDKLTFEVSESGGTDEYQLESTSTFTSTGWYHFTIVYDQDSAANTTMYINGKDDSPTKTGTITNIGGINASTADFRVGSESDDGAPFDGRIDDVRIYNYALSATQAKQLINNGAVRFGPSEGIP